MLCMTWKVTSHCSWSWQMMPNWGKGWAVDVLEVRAVIQKDLSRLEDLAGRDFCEIQQGWGQGCACGKEELLQREGFPFTQHLSDYAWSIASSFMSTPHSGSVQERCGINWSKFSTRPPRCQGAVALPWRRGWGSWACLAWRRDALWGPNGSLLPPAIRLSRRWQDIRQWS